MAGKIDINGCCCIDSTAWAVKAAGSGDFAITVKTKIWSSSETPPICALTFPDVLGVPLIGVHRHLLGDECLDVDQPMPQFGAVFPHARNAVQLGDGIAHLMARVHR